jgi:hypothetical protein
VINRKRKLESEFNNERKKRTISRFRDFLGLINKHKVFERHGFVWSMCPPHTYLWPISLLTLSSDKAIVSTMSMQNQWFPSCPCSKCYFRYRFRKEMLLQSRYPKEEETQGISLEKGKLWENCFLICVGGVWFACRVNKFYEIFWMILLFILFNRMCIHSNTRILKLHLNN